MRIILYPHRGNRRLGNKFQCPARYPPPQTEWRWAMSESKLVPGERVRCPLLAQSGHSRAHPENTKAALKGGGMHTGDLARRDADGFLWFAGRAKDIIIRGGSNISPGEVEDVLYGHPAVYEAGVIGVPCSELGQRVRAYVAFKPGAQATDSDLKDWAARSIAAYKVPESIVVLAALPKGLTGKVLRKALRDQAGREV